MCTFNFPGFERFGERDDLPEISVVPHELSASEEGAAFEGDTLGECGDVGLRFSVWQAVNANDGSGHAFRSDFAKEKVVGVTEL